MDPVENTSDPEPVHAQDGAGSASGDAFSRLFKEGMLHFMQQIMQQGYDQQQENLSVDDDD